MLKDKRVLISTGIDGTNQLFKVEDDYIAGSLWVLIVDGTTGATTSKVPVDIGGGFFQLNPAPSVGTTLRCTYGVEVPDSLQENGLSPWESKRVNDLLDIVKKQKELIDKMDLALSKRITSNDFNTWAEIIEKDIKDLKALIQ